MRLRRGTNVRAERHQLRRGVLTVPSSASLVIGGVAGLCLGALLGSMFGPAAPEWQFDRRSLEYWTRALGASSAETRTRAAYALSESPALPLTGCVRLVQHLDDESDVRDEVRLTLIRWTRAGRCLEETRAMLSPRAPATVRRLAADVLRGAGTRARRATGALMVALTDPVPDVRSLAAAAREASGDTAALVQDALTEATSDPDADVRTAAIQALTGLPSSSDHLMRVARRAARDQNPSARAAAMSALEHVDVRQSDLQTMLIRGLADSAAEVRAAAATSLGWVHSGGAEVR
jgi:HEAT repeat protein